MRAGADEEEEEESEDEERNQAVEREKLLDRLLFIRGCLVPSHYVRTNPFPFAQICLEYFFFNSASIIRAGNQISF